MYTTPSLHLFSYNDFIGVPLILAFLFPLLKIFVPRYLIDKRMQRLFYLGIVIRLFAVVAGALYYTYVEKSGDTFIYFDFAKGISKVMSTNNFEVYSKLFYASYADLPFHIKSMLPTSSLYVDVFSGNSLIMKIAGILSFFLFDSYLAISIAFTFFGYIGLWLIYYRFVSMNPKFGYIAYFFIICWPSMLFFGSGVLKEPICNGCIGLSFYFIFKKAESLSGFAKHLFIVVISSLILLQIKSYLFYSFFLSFMAAYAIHRINSLYSARKRKFVFSSVAILFFIASYFLFVNFNQILLSSQIESISEQILYSTSTQLSLGNSSYNLGKLEMSFLGILKYFLASLNVSLFRPFFFEINKIPLLIIGVESFIMLLMILYALYAIKLKTILCTIKNNPILIFSTLFVITVAIQIGAIAFNFGALMRYKIPMLPFFFFVFFCICSKEKRINRFVNHYLNMPE